MLDSKIIKKINDFVYAKPRTIQEIAFLIEKNWRTADAYVERIANEHGTISTRTFREGTRGALKVAYWNSIEKIHSSEFQEKLFRRIESGRNKEDFSPMDIFQYVEEKKRRAVIEERSNEDETDVEEFIMLLRSAKSQILFFSGNLSFINLRKVLEVLKEIAERGVLIKIMARVEIAGISNITKLLRLNDEIGKTIFEIRHCCQPLRATIVDGGVARMKEVKLPENYKRGELDKKTFIFYEIYDAEWVEWLQKVFWNLFRASISAEKRINDLKSIKALV
jgi:hypothetical protein